MYAQNPSGMATLARRLRGRPARPAPGKAAVPRMPRLLLKDVGAVLRSSAAETPRRFVLPTYAASAFTETADRLARLARGSSPDLALAYSIKTNPAPELLGLALDRGMWAEAIAQTEVTHAVGLGFPSERIVLNGPGKWWPASSKVPRYGAIFCDSLQELKTLHPLVMNGEVGAEVLGIRLRPATVNSRFGIPLHDPETIRQVVDILDRWPRGQQLGFHFHIASSMVGVRTWHALAENFLAAVELLCNRRRRRSVTLSFGGGWHPDDWPDFLKGEFPRLVAACRTRLPMVRRIILEPGKALSQRSMCLVTRVLEVRRSPKQTELVVDGSIAELPDIRSHPHRVVSLNSAGTPVVWGQGHGGDRILGRLCMEFDILSDGIQVPRSIKEGALIAYLDAGAYDASMAYSFGRGALPLPHSGRISREGLR
jgi:diaminopimelate decarboxylase